MAEQAKHHYTLRYRPFNIGTAPRDGRLIELGTYGAQYYPLSPLPTGDFKFGVMEFDRRLADQEVADYEMLKVNPTAKEPTQ